MTDVKEIKTDDESHPRSKLNMLFQMRYCVHNDCRKIVDGEWIQTGMPGISAWRCPHCQTVFQSNFLESDDDILHVSSEFFDVPSYEALCTKFGAKSVEALVARWKEETKSPVPPSSDEAFNQSMARLGYDKPARDYRLVPVTHPFIQDIKP